MFTASVILFTGSIKLMVHLSSVRMSATLHTLPVWENAPPHRWGEVSRLIWKSPTLQSAVFPTRHALFTTPGSPPLSYFQIQLAMVAVAKSPKYGARRTGAQYPPAVGTVPVFCSEAFWGPLPGAYVATTWL